MPSVSSAQHRAMKAAANGHSTLGIPKSVGQEFVNADKGRKDSAESGDCAGILFRVRKGPLYLLLKRSDTGEWCTPGGHLEDGETPMDAAERECMEEIGMCPGGTRWTVRRNSIPRGKGIFTCYLQEVSEPFEPELNEEHTNWGWFAPDALPQPMHRKVAETIERVSGNELDIAKRMARGELLSPQRYENVWLFDVRISGSGISYRSNPEEYVSRPEDYYQSEEFLQRCNGLPLIFMHPEDMILNAKEFRDRIIGTMFLPYVKGAEPWGIAKVFDDDGATLMRTSHSSTSPAVVFRDAGSNKAVELDDGSTALIEGKPSYVDHLAICEEGVWDKGEGPTGINLDGETPVENEEEKVPAWADAFMKKCDARFDALENKGEVADRKDEKKADSEDKKADEEKKADSEEKKAEEEGKKEEKDEKKAAEEIKAAEKDGEKERKAEERADAQSKKIADLEARLASVTEQLTTVTKPLSIEDKDQLAQAQSRADSIASAFGESIRAPLYGESPIAYRKSLAAKFQKHSATYKDVKLDSLDAVSFGAVENCIYADAQTAARAPANMPEGRLIEHVHIDRAGRRVSEYSGDPAAAWAPFMAPAMVARINRKFN